MKIQRLVHASSPESEDPLHKIDTNGVQKTRARPRHKSHVLIACRSCQERKCRCDGSRPTCRGCSKRGVACTYDGADGLTRMAILKNRNRELADKLAAYERFFQLLCTASDPDAQELLRNVRVSSGDVSAVLYGFRDRFGDAATIGLGPGNGGSGGGSRSGNSSNGHRNVNANGNGNGDLDGEVDGDDGGIGRRANGNTDGYDGMNDIDEYEHRAPSAGDSVIAETAMMAMMDGDGQDEMMTAAAAGTGVDAAIMPTLGEQVAPLADPTHDGDTAAFVPPRSMTALGHGGSNGTLVGAEQGPS